MLGNSWVVSVLSVPIQDSQGEGSDRKLSMKGSEAARRLGSDY